MRFGVKRALVSVFSAWAFLPLCAMAQEPALESAVELTTTELRQSLIEMGFVSVEIDGSRVRFERVLQNTCPTNKALSYKREIDIDNLNMTTISRIETVSSNRDDYFFFSVEATEEYRRKIYPILLFERKINIDYPELNWPFQVNEDLPEIRHLFLQKFPKELNLNRWTDYTCFGESPFAYITFRMSFDDVFALSEFRAALIRYTNVLASRRVRDSTHHP